MDCIRYWISKYPKIHIWAGRFRHFLIRMYMRGCRIFPMKKDKVIFVNYYGRGFGDNGKPIAQQLLLECPNIDLVWAVHSDFKDSIPAPIRTVEYRSFKYYKEMSTAKVWLDNSRKGCDLLKRNGQFYIQLWHGNYPLKKIERDVEKHLGVSYIADAKHDSKMADLILSGCGYFTEICQRAFWYEGEILQCGTPRLDCLFNDLSILQDHARKRIGISCEKKVILYVPTFRNDGNTECYALDFEHILEILNRDGDDWVFVVRLHPNVADKANFIQYNDRIYNGTSYPDLYELFSIVDIVITDYSSVMFEFGIFKKPVFLFATDIDKYTADRNFYFDLDKLPFPVARSNEELIQLISTFDQDDYVNNVTQFNSDIGICENGTATNVVVNRILEVIEQ